MNADTSCIHAGEAEDQQETTLLFEQSGADFFIRVPRKANPPPVWARRQGFLRVDGAGLGEVAPRCRATDLLDQQTSYIRFPQGDFLSSWSELHTRRQHLQDRFPRTILGRVLARKTFR